MTTPRAILTSAPGKLFLIGEYAVLEGAPAILTAVDRRARVKIVDSPDRHWYFSAPNLGIHRLQLDEYGCPADTLATEPRHQLRVFEAVRNQVTAILARPLPPLDIHIDTADFSRDRYKLGLGSSAAVAAALTFALLECAGADTRKDHVARLAIAAHRAAQNGTGSGGDVATSVHGGLIGYTRDMPPKSLTWPEGLAMTAVVTGRGASTTELVGRIKAHGKNAPAIHNVDMARLTTLSRKAIEAAMHPVRFMEVAREYFDALALLDDHARAGIISSRHHELHALAADHGAVFKSSGAGGGDVGLLFSAPPVDPATLYQAFSEAGAALIELGLYAPGVCLDTSHLR